MMDSGKPASATDGKIVNEDTMDAQAALAPDDTAPTVDKVKPTGRKAPTRANVTATFSEAIDAGTTNDATFAHEGPEDGRREGDVYDPATKTAVFDPKPSKLVSGPPTPPR